ncbi:MAG TPA: AMP-binding protein [Burkholderiaceae bacterium]
MPKSDSAQEAKAQRLLDVVRRFGAESGHGAAQLDSDFERDLGFDSLARAELLQRVGTAFGLQMPADALAGANTARELLRYLSSARPDAEAQPAAPLRDTQSVELPHAVRTLPEVLAWHARRVPDRVHIVLREGEQERAISYRALLAAAREKAAAMIELGLLPRQTVALMLPTGFDYLACFFGVLMAGGIPVPIYPPLRADQLEDHLKRHVHILSNAQAALFIAAEAALPVAHAMQASLPALDTVVAPQRLHSGRAFEDRIMQTEDVALLQYTSGSTGYPKGVALTHANLLANIRALGAASHTTPADTFVSWLPLYHDMGLIGAWLGSLYHGMPLILMPPTSFLARPALWLETITRYRGTLSAAPNFAYELCLKHVPDTLLPQLDLSGMRLLLNGAEPVSAATIEAFAARFARCGLRREAITPVYGLAESSVGLCFPPPGRGPRIDVIDGAAFAERRAARPASAETGSRLSLVSSGLPLPGHEVRIVDEIGQEVPERQVGRLEFRGPSATAGYFRNPEATRALIKDGWLDSGDYAYLADGEVFIAGRVKDLIKRGGRNFYPYDIEQAVGKIAGVRSGCVAAFAAADPARGTEKLVVMAETRIIDAAGLAALRRAIDHAALDIIGSPADDVVLVPPHTVPKTSSGKLRRLACRDMYESGAWRGQPERARWQAARLRLKAWRAQAGAWAKRGAAVLYGCYAWLVFTILALGFGTAIVAQRQAGRARRLARKAARLYFACAGMPLDAAGLDRLPAAPHVLLLNHASYLDAIALYAMLPPGRGYAFAAKRELAGNIVLRTLLGRLGCAWIERFDMSRLDADVEAMADVLRRGDSLVVFPEGGFTRAAGLRAFHLGGLIAAARAGAPVVAAGLRGTRAALRDETWLPRRGRLALCVGKARQVGAAWGDLLAARDALREEVAALCGEHLLNA